MEKATMKPTNRVEAKLNADDRKLLDDLARHYGNDSQAIRLAIRALHKELTQ